MFHGDFSSFNNVYNLIVPGIHILYFTFSCERELKENERRIIVAYSVKIKERNGSVCRMRYVLILAHFCSEKL